MNKENNSLLEFYTDQIVTLGGDITCLSRLTHLGQVEFETMLNLYMEHLKQAVKLRFLLQHGTGLVEVPKGNQVACVVNDTYQADRYTVVIYDAKGPICDMRYDNIDAAWEELIHQGFNHPHSGCLDALLNQPELALN